MSQEFHRRVAMILRLTTANEKGTFRFFEGMRIITFRGVNGRRVPGG